MAKNKAQQAQIGLIFGTAVVVIAIIAALSSIYTIDAGEKGVLLTWGKPVAVVDSGIHFKIPIAQSVVIFSTRTQKYEAELSSASKDLQDVITKVAINYRIDPNRITEIYTKLGTDYSNTVIYPSEQEANKASTAKYNAGELINNREDVRATMISLLREKLEGRGIIIEDISIVDFDFSEIFKQSIEQKVTAEQNALTAKNKLVQIEYEAQQRITQARGEAEAIKIQIESIQKQGGDEYVRLQAINKWNGQLPQVTGAGAIPFLNLNITG